MTKNCQHVASLQKCLYCALLEPYDEEYLKTEGVKHMSFHSFLKVSESKLYSACANNYAFNELGDFRPATFQAGVAAITDLSTWRLPN